MTRNKFKLRNLKLKLFRDLNPSIVTTWESIATVYQMKAGETLYSQGEVARTFFIILEGGVRLVEFTPSGKAVTIKVYGQGDMFGLLALSYEHQHAATVEAVSNTQIIAFRADAARELLKQDGTIALRLLGHMTEHVHHAHERIRHLAAEKTQQRLARAILHFYKKFGTLHDDLHVINAELSQRDIAEFTGTTIETVNRYLRDWEKRGWIQLSWKHIDIVQPEKLEEIAASINQYGYIPE